MIVPQPSSDDQIAETVRRALAARLGVSRRSVALDHRLVEDLGVSSLDFLELRTELEAVIGRPVEEERLEEVRTVADVVRVITESR